MSFGNLRPSVNGLPRCVLCSRSSQLKARESPSAKESHMTRKKRSHRLTPKDARERRKQMTTMRRQGYTLAEIGNRFRITGSRVSQILSS
jgi:DNA-directed RNA polymerase sigma subunit (sigma70/sigma32)